MSKLYLPPMEFHYKKPTIEVKEQYEDRSIFTGKKTLKERIIEKHVQEDDIALWTRINHKIIALKAEIYHVETLFQTNFTGNNVRNYDDKRYVGTYVVGYRIFARQ